MHRRGPLILHTVIHRHRFLIKIMPTLYFCKNYNHTPTMHKFKADTSSPNLSIEHLFNNTPNTQSRPSRPTTHNTQFNKNFNTPFGRGGHRKLDQNNNKSTKDQRTSPQAKQIPIQKNLLSYLYLLIYICFVVNLMLV